MDRNALDLAMQGAIQSGNFEDAYKIEQQIKGAGQGGIGRQLGLTARAGLGGIGKTLTGINDLVTGAADAGLEAIGSDFRFGRATPYVEQGLDAIGLPTPQNATERAVNRAGEFVAGAALPVGLGGRMAGATDDVARGVGELLQSQPGMQASGAAAGGLANYATEDAGPGAQMAATLAASLAPAASTAAASGAYRAALRGTDPQAMQANIRAFEAAGTTPSVAQATGNRRAAYMESMLNKMPGAAGRMNKFMGQQAEDIGSRLGQEVDDVARGADPTKAGRAITEGAKGFANRFFQKAEQVYGEVDRYINPRFQMNMSNTERLLSAPKAVAQDAPATAGVLRPGYLRSLEDAIGEDLAAQVAKTGVKGMPYETVKQIRSMVGERLGSPSLTVDASTADLKRIYGALSEDMLEAAKANGPQAVKAAQRASQFYKAGSKRLDDIEGIVGSKQFDKTFKSLISGAKDGPTGLRTIMKSLQPDERKYVSAAFIKQLGRPTPGRGNTLNLTPDEMAKDFSLRTYLSNWRAIKDPSSRSMLLGDNPQLRKATDAIARAAQNTDEAWKVFPNPSGTTPAWIQSALTTGGAVSAVMGSASGLSLAIALPVSANLMARLVTNPNYVNWLARTTTMPPSAFPTALNTLAQMAEQTGDPDLLALTEELASQPQNQQQ